MGRLYPTPSDDAARIWRDFAADHGVSYTGLMEALADELRRLQHVPESKLPPLWREAISKARSHDAVSRSRATPD